MAFLLQNRSVELLKETESNQPQLGKTLICSSSTNGLQIDKMFRKTGCKVYKKLHKYGNSASVYYAILEQNLGERYCLKNCLTIFHLQAAVIVTDLNFLIQ